MSPRWTSASLARVKPQCLWPSSHPIVQRWSSNAGGGGNSRYASYAVDDVHQTRADHIGRWRMGDDCVEDKKRDRLKCRSMNPSYVPPRSKMAVRSQDRGPGAGLKAGQEESQDMMNGFSRGLDEG